MPSKHRSYLPPSSVVAGDDVCDSSRHTLLHVCITQFADLQAPATGSFIATTQRCGTGHLATSRHRLFGDNPDVLGGGCRSNEQPTSDGSRRTLAMSALAPVIPIKPYQKNRLVPRREPRIPEPAQLYCLITLTFVLHTPVTAGDMCGQCGEPWPCARVRLAFRLREGF